MTQEPELIQADWVHTLHALCDVPARVMFLLMQVQHKPQMPNMPYKRAAEHPIVIQVHLQAVHWQICAY